MERKDDIQLIQRILSGDDSAFTILVQKHQKSIHTFVWRRVGDFHLAEEIAQDTFLIAYQKLSTLKDPRSFAGWLYRIAARQCVTVQRKKEIQMESLDHINIKRIEKISYSQYIAKKQRETLTEAQRNLIHKLLAQLPKVERTVITLHYLREMTCQEISQFLGVPICTVKSQLHRARRRLKRET